MEESEENISADSTKLDDTLSSTKPKIKKRSLIERELETSLTARITSPVTYSDATSTSRYGRSRRLKTENDFIDTEKAVSKALKSPNVEKTPIKAQSPAHKMHATNSSAKKELMDVTPNKSGSVELNLSNQIENIYQENLMLSRFGSTDSNKDSTSPSKQAKVYVRKDLIQKRDKDEMVTLIKNLFTPSSAQKSPNNHLSNILERSSEKYTLEDSGTKQKSPICFTSTPSVVKTLDFDSNKKKPKDAKSILTKSELFDLEAKCEYQVGDLAWARMGTYPFWPCIVTREQSSGLFVKLKLFGRVERDLIHVTFFGDNGRHSWIVDSMLRKFLGQLEFEATREHFSPTTKKKDPKLYAAFCISEKKMPQWSISVEEAETLLREPKRLRLDIFNDMLIKSRNAKATTKSRKTVKLIRTDSDVSLSESLYDTLFSADNGKSDDPDRSRSKTRKSLDVSEVVTACLDNMAAKTGMTKIKKQSHMDRWLQKAKSKTPEKSQVKALPIKEKRATLSSSKKKKHQTPKKVPDKTPIKKSNESRKSSGKKPKDLDNSISDPVTSGSGIGVISKVESLRDKLADELSKAVAEMEYLENDHVETYENYSLKVPEISVPVSESPTFTQSFDDFNRNESENVRAPMVMETHISIERDMSDDNMFDETEQSIIESADPPEASSEDISDVNSAMDTCSASFLFMNGHIDDSISENSILGRHNSVRKLRGPKISNEICRHIDISIDIDVSRDTSNNKGEMSVDTDHNSSKETSICNGLEITVNSEDRSLNSSLKSVKSGRGRKATKKKRISFTCLSKSTPKKQNLRKKNRKSDETPKEDSFTRYLELRQDAIIDEHPELTKVEVVEYLRKAWQYEQNVTADPANDGEIRKNREEKGPQNAAVITVTKIADYEPKICTVKLNDVLQNNKYSRTHNNITSDSNPLKYKDCVEINNDISNITSETSNTVNIESSVSGDAISSNNETKIPSNDNSEVLDDNSLNNPQLSCISKLDDEARKKIINEIVLGKCESEESKFNSDIINDDDKVHITTDTLDKSEETSCDIETHIKSDSIKTNSNVTDNDIDPNVLVSKLDMDVDNNKLTLQEKNKADAESIKSNTIKEKLEEKSVDLVKLVVNEKESIEQNKDELGLIECNRQIISNDADVCIDSIDLNENVQLERICADSPEDDCHKGKNEFSLSCANNNCKEDINESSNLDATPDHIHDAVLVSKEIDNVTKECFETTDVLYNSNDTVKIDINDDVETFNEQAAVEDIICENDTGNLMDNKDFPNAVATENVVKEIHSLVSEECVEMKDINNDDEIDAIEPVDTHLVEETDIMEVVEDVKNMEKEDDGTTNDDVINEECIEKDALYSASEEVNYLQELNNSEKSVNSNVKISTTVSSPSQKESIQNTVEGLPSEVQIQDQNHRHEICIELATDADAAANNVNTTEANEQVLIKEMNNIDHVIEENDEHETETSKELIKKQEVIAPHNSDVNDTEKSMLPKELPEPIKVNGFHCDHENGPDFSDSELTAETASIHSEDSEPLSKVKYNLSLKKRKTKVPLQEPEFLKYMELRQDALVDEHPELSQDQIVEYMYKTWQYEENCKSDLMKNDEIEQIGIVKGLNEDLRQKSIRNSFRESRKRKKQNDDDAMSVSSDNSDSIPKKSLRVRLTRSPLITLNDCWKKQSKENSPERKADDADEVISVNSDASDQPLTRNLRKKKEAASTEIIEVDSSSTSSKQAQNVEDIKESVAEKEKSPSPSSNESTKPKRYFDVFKQSIKEHLTDEKKQETSVKKIKDEFDPETASINSEDSECSSIKRKPRKHGEKSKQDMDNPEFLKYFELRQDQLLEENPDLTQEEITSYLYKTWLYEESVKSDLMKTDELEQANLVKGLSTEVSQVRKPRKKIKTEKEASSENDIQKDKPKRKTSQPYYNEDLSDMEEDDIEVFDIFKPKSKHLGPKLENGEPEISDIVDLEEDYVDEVELYFAKLTKPKPNLFKGLVREKVCDICERTGNLVKCKGCNNAFHVECVKKMAEVVAVPTTPARGRKKKKKPGRKPKNLDESESQSDEKSQDISEENNASIDDIVEPETWVVDADNFEAVLAAKMQELIPSDPNYDSYSCEESINWKAAVAGKCEIIDVKSKPKDDYSNFKCKNCQTHDIPVCFVCKNALSKSGVDYRQRCQTAHCNKYYHMECLDHWPQTQFKAGELSKNNKKGNERFEEFMCPRHVCHTCVSDDPRGCKTRFSGDKLARCVRCPATYHTFTKCLPAGSQILTGSHIVCPRHYDHRPGKVPCHVNTGWCFLCALGGSLICCEYCPTSFHAECLNIKPPEGGYMCEDCETGRLPLYGEMVWVKLGHYRWWPGLILHPKEIPDNIMAVKHSPGEFVVRFFGQYDHYWVNRGRVFPFQEGDTGRISSQKSKIDAAFTMAIEHAQRACEILKAAEPNEEEDTDIASSLLPPHYVKLKVNKPVGSLCGRRIDIEESSLTQCECNPDEEDPCGLYSQCLNRMLLTECGPLCRAGDRCSNRAFEKRQYPRLAPYKTPHRGWGLKTLQDIKAGQFVIEYVGELIDEEEFRRRMSRKHEIRDENYYFLTLDKERMIDAGPKGNLARFMNHCCEPNCETQKWTVLGDVRVGLFAMKDIPANSELTFNYNLECAGIEKKRCLCGAKRCSGYMGAKPKQEETQPKKHRPGKRTYKKRKNVEDSPSTVKNKPKRPVGRPMKPRELTEIEKDLLIIKNATNGLSSDSEGSSRLSSVEQDRNSKALKRKRVSFSTDDVSPSTKKPKVDEEKAEVGD